MISVRFLLDANVISEMMRAAPEPRVAAVLDDIAAEGLGIASITAWEILNGVSLLAPGRRRADLADRFRGLLDDYFAERVIDWTLGDAASCARIMERKRRGGEPLDDHLPDAMLAGLAANRDLVVVTRNESEFRNTGVTILNPWTVAPSAASR